jgi:hypothetical protein
LQTLDLTLRFGPMRIQSDGEFLRVCRLTRFSERAKNLLLGRIGVLQYRQKQIIKSLNRWLSWRPPSASAVVSFNDNQTPLFLALRVRVISQWLAASPRLRYVAC